MAQVVKRLSAGGNQYDLILDVTQGTQNIANNTTSVSWSLWIRKNSGSGYSASDVKNWNVNIGGQTKSGTIKGYSFVGKTSITLGSGSFTIAHNADGTKSISISGTFTDSGATGIGSGTASGSMTLTTIPRASSFGTISGSTLGSGITININRASSSFTHELWYHFGTVTWQSIGSGVGTSVTFTPPISLATQIPNTTTGVMSITLRTKNGSTTIGSDVSKTFNVSVPTSLVPSAGTLSLSQGNSNAAGTYVQGFSSVTASLSGYGGVQGSTISSVKITGAGHTINGASGTTPVLSNSGTVTFTATVTDSRGRSSTTTSSVTFLAYSPPQIVSASIQRTDASGTATWNGAYMKYTYHVKVASLMVGGVQKNGVQTVYFDYGANYGNWGYVNHPTVIEASGSKTYGTITITSSVPARINAYDKMGRYTTWTGQVSAGTVALDIGDNNVGVGKFWERGTIDSVGQIFQNNGVEVASGYVGQLPAGDAKSGAYWRSLKPGLYMKVDSIAQTNQLSNWAHVWVHSSGEGSGERTIIWKEKADGQIYHSGTNDNTGNMVWKKLASLMDDGTGYEGFTGTTSWMRSPTSGFIPATPGGSALGSPSWKWSNVYTNNLNGWWMEGRPLTTALNRRYQIKSAANTTYTIASSWGSTGIKFQAGDYGGAWVSGDGLTITFNGNFTNVTVSVYSTINNVNVANCAFQMSGTMRRGGTVIAESQSGWLTHTAGYSCRNMTILCGDVVVGDTMQFTIGSSLANAGFNVNACVIQIMGYAY